MPRDSPCRDRGTLCAQASRLLDRRRLRVCSATTSRPLTRFDHASRENAFSDHPLRSGSFPQTAAHSIIHRPEGSRQGEAIVASFAKKWQIAFTGLCCAPSERLPSFCNPTRGGASRLCRCALPQAFTLRHVGPITRHDDESKRTSRHNAGLSCAPPRSRLCEEPGPCGPFSIVAESSESSRWFTRTAPWSLAIQR